jgi:hypothetical protein
VKYWFDNRDCISKVDEQWHRFAAENGAADLTADAVKGRHLSSFISDPGTYELWKKLLQRAREGVPIALTIRCDAPDRRRTLSIKLRTDRSRIRVTSTLVAQEFRPAIELLRGPREAQGDALVACGWCRRFELAAGAWVEVEVLAENLHLLALPVLPPVRHGLCPTCFETASAQATRHSTPEDGPSRTTG